jgi:hypothetical protein
VHVRDRELPRCEPDGVPHVRRVLHDVLDGDQAADGRDDPPLGIQLHGDLGLEDRDLLVALMQVDDVVAAARALHGEVGCELRAAVDAEGRRSRVRRHGSRRRARARGQIAGAAGEQLVQLRVAGRHSRSPGSSTTSSNASYRGPAAAARRDRAGRV